MNSRSEIVTAGPRARWADRAYSAHDRRTIRRAISIKHGRHAS
jgi:hypothetical protein